MHDGLRVTMACSVEDQSTREMIDAWSHSWALKASFISCQTTPKASMTLSLLTRTTTCGLLMLSIWNRDNALRPMINHTASGDLLIPFKNRHFVLRLGSAPVNSNLQSFSVSRFNIPAGGVRYHVIYDFSMAGSKTDMKLNSQQSRRRQFNSDYAAW